MISFFKVTKNFENICLIIHLTQNLFSFPNSTVFELDIFNGSVYVLRNALYHVAGIGFCKP